MKPIYTVTYPHGGLVSQTDWAPIAEAAWHRATRDTHGGYARCTLSIDGRQVAAGNCTAPGLRWPQQLPTVGTAELYKAVLLVAHQLGIGPVELADIATQKCLPLSRANIDDGRRGKGGSLPEICVLLYCIVHAIKSSDANDDAR